MPAPPPRAWGRESNHGSGVGEATAADWRPGWPDDRPVLCRTSGAWRCGNPERRISCSNGTSVGSLCSSCGQRSEEKAADWIKKTETEEERKSKKEEQFSVRMTEENQSGRRRNFKPPEFLHFQSALHSKWIPRSPPANTAPSSASRRSTCPPTRDRRSWPEGQRALAFSNSATATSPR